MAQTPQRQPARSTPCRRTCSGEEEQEEEDIIVVDTTPQAARITNPLDSSPQLDTPASGTRKRKIDFANLHNFGFQCPPPVSPKPGPLAKKARVMAAAKSLESSQVALIPDEIEEEDDEDILIKKKKQLNASGKRAWWWKYYTIKTLITKYDKGKGKVKDRVFDEKYTCTLCKNFNRLASRLSGATTGLSNHIQVDYKRSNNESLRATEKKQAGLNKFMKSKEELPEFEEAMVDWIIETC